MALNERTRLQFGRDVRLFVKELLEDVPVHPLTTEIAILAGRLDGAQQRKGIKIPFADLLIGATALYAGCAVVTQNPRHFAMIPNLTVRQL